MVAVADWPRLASGKIDVASLPEPGPDLRHPRTRRPEGLLENELADMWEQRLGERPQDVADDFFELGGNSLHAIVLAGAVSRWIGVTVSVADVFDRPTLAEQALLVEHLLVPETARDDGEA
ncbi:hypothetical protein BJF83_06365 [Nocardiopsis sp. CNR-923]|uniref:phosphopantetheine-binding protein n=1 Tax=Nocardiopsis sp. CNR-923 TaxID=1904965 RepID=UPI00096293C7|nr:phosphopantetheine-binding protein [Nocardiopsis sp. CNR-923]OLT24605.1 hypothetical protein BJF83_06365 [Nocardiopsis sp. CNR-923]